MYELSEPVKIKDLPIVKMQESFLMIKYNFEECEQYGVNLFELHANPLAYTRLFEFRFNAGYICAVACMVKFFREIFDRELYSFRIYMDNNSLYQINFNNIFDHVNKEFNIYIDDSYLFDEFFIYESEISISTFQIIYNTFMNILNNEINTILKSPNIIRSSIINKRRQLYCIVDLYNEFYNGFDDAKDMYLLFQ